MESNIIKQFNLPSYIKGKTFADASKTIDRKFKDRSDKYSEQTKQELLSRLAEAQEYIKQREDAIAANSTQVPDMMGGEIPQGMEQFNDGGLIEEPEVEGGIEAMDIAGATSSLVSAGQDIFGNTGIDTAGNQRYDDASTKKAQVSGTIEGAVGLGTSIATGDVMGMIKGGAGMLGSFFGGKKKLKDMQDANRNHTVAQTANYRSDFGMGGIINKYDNGGPLDQTLINDYNPRDIAAELYKEYNIKDIDFKKTFGGVSKKGQSKLNNAAFESSLGNPIDNLAIAKSEKTDLGLGIKRGADWLKENYGNIASYAPIVGNIAELSKLDKPTTEKGSRLDNKYNKKLFDNEALINKVNQNDVNSALKEASGGDLGALRSNILASNANKTKAISNAMMQADQVNRSENQYQFQTDMQKDQTNANLNERYLDRKARDKGAYETAKSKLKQSIYEDIGKVGQDIVNKDLVKDMFGYTWDGEYFVDPKGKKYSQQEVALMKAKKDKTDKENQSMFGGYVKNKK